MACEVMNLWQSSAVGLFTSSPGLDDTMTNYQLPYGHSQLTLQIDDDYSVDWIEPPFVPAADNPKEVVREALRHPIDGLSLQSFTSTHRVAIAINDKTRPVPHEHLLPPLLDELHAMGIPEKAIQFFVATGTHLPMMPEEMPRILPAEITRRFEVISHNCDDNSNLVYLGLTTRGTPIWVNRQFFNADLKIVVGDIEPHHFAGFSGGYKTAAIGLSGRETINRNHKMLVEPDARIAEFEKNPLRQDIDEIGDAFGIQVALNAILNSEKRIVSAVCGSPRAVMQAGVPLSRAVCQVSVPHVGEYDLVVASVGGAPKDINFYQSQKALTHAALLVKDQGAIILAAECPEGSGSQSYEEYMAGLLTPEDVLDKFARTGFQVGPHKAFQVAKIASRAHIYLVSNMNEDLTTRLLMTPASSLDQAFEMAVSQLPLADQHALRIAILPRATNTIPHSI